MANIVRPALLGVCIVLCLILLGEVISAISTSGVPIDAPELTRERIRPPATASADRLAALILKRPLFTPGRQPPELKVKKPEPPTLQGRLAGISISPNTREAVFTRPGRKSISVREGDVIDGWTVRAIEADHVVLYCSFGEKVVTPTYATADELAPPKPRAVVKPAAAKPSSAAPTASQPQQQSTVQVSNKVATVGTTRP